MNSAAVRQEFNKKQSILLCLFKNICGVVCIIWNMKYVSVEMFAVSP